MAAPGPFRSSRDSWRKAYAFAVGNAFAFAVLSIIDAALSVESAPWQAVVAAGFCLGSVVAFVRLIRTGGGLPFVAFFVLGCGVIFGFGSAYATVGNTNDFQIFFPPWVQGEALRSINLINSVSVLIVLLAAWPFCSLPNSDLSGETPIGKLLGAGQRFQTPLMVVSAVVLGLEIMTFPAPSNLLVAGALRAVLPLPLIAITLTFARAEKSGAGRLAIAAAMTALMAALGLLRESKSDVMLPLVAVAAGLWLEHRFRRAAIVLVVSCIAVYFALVAPITTVARDYANAAGGVTDLAGGVEYLEAAWRDLGHPRAGPHDNQAFAGRFSDAPFQTFLIQQYDEGRPGDSLQGAWAAAIPRVFWSDKPDVTRFGHELYGLVNNTSEAHSALAPTYTAEAYWNGGWLTLLSVSLMIGLELGWLTRKWLLLASGRSQNVGILVMAIPTALLAFWVESWIAAAYIGGFLTLAVLIKAVDVAANAASKSREGRRAPVRYLSGARS